LRNFGTATKPKPNIKYLEDIKENNMTREEMDTILNAAFAKVFGDKW